MQSAFPEERGDDGIDQYARGPFLPEVFTQLTSHKRECVAYLNVEANAEAYNSPRSVGLGTRALIQEK